MTDPWSPAGPEEHRFLEQLLADPEDAALHQVYADWLEEQGELERAEILRLGDRPDAGAPAWRERYRELAGGVSLGWLALIDRFVSGGCTTQESGEHWAPAVLRFACPERWQAMTVTLHPRVRFCEGCNKPVYYCETASEIDTRAKVGQCVAIPGWIEHEGRIERRMMAGMPFIPSIPATSVVFHPGSPFARGARVRVRVVHAQSDPLDDAIHHADEGQIGTVRTVFPDRVRVELDTGPVVSVAPQWLIPLDE